MEGKRNRGEVTAELSEKVWARLCRENALVASEVWVDDASRVDFVAYRPPRSHVHTYMYMRVYAFTYMRIWVDSHRVETKREGMVRMAPFISENIDLVPCMAMAFNAAIATMGFLKMVAWTEHGMSSRMSRYIDRFGKMGIDREILEVYARSYLDESRNALICWIVGLAITMAVGIVIWAHDVGVAVLLTSVVAAAVSIRCIVMAVRDVADIRDVLAEIDLGTPTA